MAKKKENNKEKDNDLESSLNKSALSELREYIGEKNEELVDNSVDISVSYRLGVSVLDESIGYVQFVKLPNGKTIKQYQIGVPAGSITSFVGKSQTGKTSLAIKAAWNIIEPFGNDSLVTHIDVENSTDLFRIQNITNADVDDIKSRYVIKGALTFDDILKIITARVEQKKSDKERYMYNTGKYNIYGEEIVYYKPDVILIDSLLAVYNSEEDIDKKINIADNPRAALYIGMFLKAVLNYTKQFNIMIFLIAHEGKQMAMGMTHQSKEMVYADNELHIPGGEKVRLYSSTIITFKTINDKKELAERNIVGYDGYPIIMKAIKSRSMKSGAIATLFFTQSLGFDNRIILLDFAKRNGLIYGNSANSRFEPDINKAKVKFNYNDFIFEVAKNPEILRELMKACKPKLMELIPIPNLQGETKKVREIIKDTLSYDSEEIEEDLTEPKSNIENNDVENE